MRIDRIQNARSRDLPEIARLHKPRDAEQQRDHHRRESDDKAVSQTLHRSATKRIRIVRPIQMRREPDRRSGKEFTT